jgi:NTE family protein
MREDAKICLILGGGLGLGAYQGGAYEYLAAQGLEPQWLVGSSAGAVNAALIAGSPPAERAEALHNFWVDGRLWASPTRSLVPHGPFRHAHNWLNALGTRVTGAAGLFYPRLQTSLTTFQSLYDLAPMRRRLEAFIDFDRLNAGDIRLSISATDIETGAQVVFDTQHSSPLTIDHVMASCGLLPEFAPVEISGRLVGDGGLDANTPVGLVFDEAMDGPRDIYVIDLFSPDGQRPRSLTGAIERKNDLVFSNGTIENIRCYYAGRRHAATVPNERICYLSFRAPIDEAGPEKLFDLSIANIQSRWQAGAGDMEEGLARMAKCENGGIMMVRRPASI